MKTSKFNHLKSKYHKKNILNRMVKRKPSSDEKCLIFYDELNNDDDIDYCKIIVKKIFTKWMSLQQRKNCIFCKHPWYL